MSPSVRDLAVSWREAGNQTPPRLPDRKGALQRARALLTTRPSHRLVVRSEVDKDTLHALVWIAQNDPSDKRVRRRVLKILAGAVWSDDYLGELGDLRSSVLQSVCHASPAEVSSRSHPAPSNGDQTSSAQAIAEQLLLSIRSGETVAFVRGERGRAVSKMMALLTERVESSPLEGYLAAKRLAENLQDEPEHRGLAGEATLLAAAGARLLHKFRECSDIIDRAEALFQSAGAHAEDMARVHYQRLALALEDRRVSTVLQEAGSLAREFDSYGMWEWALKSRYLEGGAYREIGQADVGIRIGQEVLTSARKRRSRRLEAYALVFVAGCHADVSDPDAAVRFAFEAENALRVHENQVTLAKLHWTLGNLFRSLGRFEAAERTLHAAMAELHRLRLPAEVAAIRLVLAEVFLAMGRPIDARSELRAALPVIGEYEMLPEGVAAVSLLRESLRRRNVDRKALTNLQEFFQRRRS